MPDDFIRTGVDDLLELLKSVNKIPLSEAASKLGVNQSLVQSWVDFLVEEEIVGIEYKFTKPLIYLNKAPQASVVSKGDGDEYGLDYYRDEFKKRAEERRIPTNKIDFFWKHHLQDVANSKKELFVREAHRRKLGNIEGLWEEYLTVLLKS
ncbi:hypothetical protein JW826_05995 [Candidatus Woesearchaeota archaeon]|nr:hypothetical protein [Candidatus Woesearchaeota archaeon]